MWLRTLLIALLIFFLLRFVIRLVRGVAAGMSAEGSSSGARGSGSAVKMVPDPVCGTYVVPGKALHATRGRDTRYFCSESCRSKWVQS